MEKLVVVLAIALAAPLAAVAQVGPPAGGPPPGGMGMGPGMKHGMGMGAGMEAGKARHDPRRARLALTLGLAETLDLDEAQTLKLRESVDRFTQKRQPLMEQQHEAMKVLRTAAAADKPEAAAVDQAIARLHDARAQVQAADKDFFAAVTKDLAPQKKARAALFLGRFHGGMMRHGGPGGPGHHGRSGMGPMHGQGGMAGAGPGDELSLADDDLDDDF